LINSKAARQFSTGNKFRRRPKRGRGGRGVWGEFRLARAEAKPRRPARSEQTDKEKFCSQFFICARRFFSSKRKTKPFFGGARVSEWRRGGASKFSVRIFAKKSSDFVQRSEPNCMFGVCCLGAKRLGTRPVGNKT